MTKKVFFDTIEKNSINLTQNKARFESLLEEQRSINSWNSPYTEIETGFSKNAIGKQEPQTTAFIMINPKLPWVQTLLRKSLKLQGEEYHKSYQLYKNLAFISAKRLYLTYMLEKEKYRIYGQRELNFLSQLEIAKSKVAAGSMSQKDYINFNNSYLDAKLLKMQSEIQLLDLQRSLHQILGIQQVHAANDWDSVHFGSDIEILGLNFEYTNISMNAAKQILEKSLYTEILDLQAKNYQNSAKLANRERFDSLELGGGIIGTESSIGATFRFIVPIPITPKNTHLKRKFLALHSGVLKEAEITKRNLYISADSYYDQLENKKRYIELQRKNIENKKNLVQMGKIAYEAQKISLFEYLAYQNAYMDSLITLADAKIDYIVIHSMFEETLGVVLGD